jgi:hypothetical protein
VYVDLNHDGKIDQNDMTRDLLSKPEHGKYVSIDKLAEIITYNISFIRGNSKGRISQQEILNEITT